MRFGLSFHEGKLDAGLIMEGDLNVMSRSKFLGGGRIEAAYDTGDFDTQRGGINTRTEVGLGKGGFSVSRDTKTGEFSGVSVGFGPQGGLSYGGSNINTISVRQVYREIFAPAVDKVKQLLGKPTERSP